MARFRLRSLRRALMPNTNSTQNESVHFHTGPQGRPEVCFSHACSRPRLDVH